MQKDSKQQLSTYMPIVEVVQERFYIPQLERYRKIYALLPYNYYHSNKSYKVLYMHDAQNLFGGGSEFGDWQVDQHMAELAMEGKDDLIVIAVEHGEQERTKEYVFKLENIIEQGEGKRYIRFITDTLKPYIDAKYKTSKKREDTGIGGSSLGGLISIYAGFLYPEVYARLLIFSPSLWVLPETKFPMIDFFNPFESKMYIYGGMKEGSEMTERIGTFVGELEEASMSPDVEMKFRISINPEGQHRESYWSAEFNKAVNYLFYEQPKQKR